MKRHHYVSNKAALKAKISKFSESFSYHLKNFRMYLSTLNGSIDLTRPRINGFV